MKVPLTERWASWIAVAGPCRSCDNLITFRFLRDEIWPQLAQAGFKTPSRRSLQEALTASLVELPIKRIQQNECMCCSFANLLNLLWAPVVEYMDSCVSQTAPEWTQELAFQHAALVEEMVGTVIAPDDALPIDDWIDFMRQTLLRLLEVDVPARLILEVVSSVVPWHAPATPATALHILRSGACDKLVGPTLAAQANRLILAEIAEVPVDLIAPADLAQGVQRDLIASLEQRSCGSTDIDEPGRPKKRSRTTVAIDENMASKTNQILFMLRNRLPASRMQSTIASAYELLQMEQSGSIGGTEAFENMLTDSPLRQHLLLLDGAVDRCMADKLMSLREAGRFAGVALATDESPPSQPRFRGLRFQVTVFYMGTFEDLHRWNACADPPILKSTCLADIMHCPGKKGVDVSRIIEKQLARFGLNCFDVVSATGDGGGENEGHRGVHAHFENLNPGYIRRRCLPHISWRTCDMAIRAAGLSYRTLAAYLVEGITWGRLRELATRSVRNGGLGLFADSSQQCKDVFGKSPSAIVETRPETDLNFLKLLEGKAHLFHAMATKDLEQRSLSAETREAILHLADIKGRICRRILQEILERCQFLYYWSGKNPSVASECSWDELMEKAVSLILSLEIEQRVLERFRMTDEGLAALHTRPRTWVELVLLQVLGEEDLIAERLPESLEFHRTVSDQAAAHLHLLADNTFRTPWMAAKLLSKNKTLAKGAASSLVKHLDTTRPCNRTSFEEHLFTQQELWQNLQEFSQAEPAVLLWHDNGRFERLFKLLAPRFLLAPDHVLDSERIHAR